MPVQGHLPNLVGRVSIREFSLFTRPSSLPCVSGSISGKPLTELDLFHRVLTYLPICGAAIKVSASAWKRLPHLTPDTFIMPLADDSGEEVMGAMLVDSHTHLLRLEVSPERAVRSAAEVGVVAVVNVGTDVEDSQRGAELAAVLPNVYSTAGIHPHN